MMQESFINNFSEFVLFKEVVFSIWQVCGWTHNDEPDFNMVAWQI